MSYLIYQLFQGWFISLKWERLFHSNERRLFHSNEEGFISFEWGVYFISMRGLFHSNEEGLMIIFSSFCYRNCFLSQKSAWLIGSTSSQTSRPRVYECRCASSFVIEQFIWFEYNRTMLTLNEKTDYACKCFEISSCSRQSMTWYKKLSQNRIQKWIERISRHIQRVIELNEDNEYREDREDDEDDDDIRSYDADDRRTRYFKEKRAFLDDDDDDEMSEMSDVSDVSDFSDDDEWFFSRCKFLMR